MRLSWRSGAVAVVAGLAGASARGLGWDRPPWPLMLLDGLLLAGGALAMGRVTSQRLSPRWANLTASWGVLLAYAADNLLRGHPEPALLSLAAGALVCALLSLAAHRVAALAGALALVIVASEGRAQPRPPGPPAPNRRSVLLIVIDTLRRDHMSLYGYSRQTTPNIDAFAEEGRVYTETLSAASHTLPSHASMFTGFYPRTHGARLLRTPEGSELRGLHPSFETLAEMAHAGGVQSAGIAANFTTGPNGIEQGFDTWATPSPSTWPRFTPSDQLLALLTPSVSWYERYPVVADAAQISREAERWLERNGDQRFFLFLNYMDVHQPTWRTDAAFLPHDPIEEDFDQLSAVEAIEGLRDPERAPGLRAALINRYDRGLHEADAQIGELLRWMEARGLLENTTVILTSDHGEYLGEHGYAFHPIGLHRRALEVPLIVRGPGYSPGRDPRPTSGVDVFIAVLEALDLRVPKQTAGRSLRGPGRPPVAELETQFQPSLLEPPYGATLDRRVTAIRLGSLHFLRYGDGQFEGWDLSEDPEESRDICPAQPERCAEASAQLDAFVRDNEGRGEDVERPRSPQ